MLDVVYRQRLTGLGWFGAICFVFGQAAGSVAAVFAIEAAMSKFDDPTGPALLALACSAAVFIGLVMILVGREHYPFTPNEPTALPTDKSERAARQEDLNRRAEEHFGKPVE